MTTWCVYKTKEGEYKCSSASLAIYMGWDIIYKSTFSDCWDIKRDLDSGIIKEEDL